MSAAGAYEKPRFAVDAVDALRDREREADLERAIALLHNRFARLVGDLDVAGRPGLLLSGGVDSGLLLALLCEAGIEPICFTAGTPDSPDLAAAAAVAHAFDVPWEPVPIDAATVLAQLEALSRELRFGGLLALSSGLLLDGCLRAARTRGVEVMWAGNGLDLLFGGGLDAAALRGAEGETFDERYWTHTLRLVLDWHRHADPINVYGRLGARHGIRFALPFERWDALDAATRIDASLLFAHGQDKWVVRQLAARLGVPQPAFVSTKNAFQRSSGMLIALREAMVAAVAELCPDQISAGYRPDADPHLDLRCFVQLVADRAARSAEDQPAADAPRPRR